MGADEGDKRRTQTQPEEGVDRHELSTILPTAPLPWGPGEVVMESSHRLAILLLFSILASSQARAQNTYYVRPDGGSASQCTGLADAPYPGGGTSQPCAWNHPFQAFPPAAAARIAGGDTLVVGTGAYRMGYGAPGAVGSSCEDDWGAYECHMSAVPSGPDAAHPTRILGVGWDTDCSEPPELWGAERPWMVLNLTSSSHVEVACLEVTDHSSCIEDHNYQQQPCGGCDVPCERDTPPYGDWAPVGVFASDSSGVSLTDVNVHGLASIGIHAGRLTDWSLDGVRIHGNGSAGWDGDLWDDFGDSNSGDLLFTDVEIGYNGCSEDWTTGQVVESSCWGQNAGGYGDGLAAGAGGGRWVFAGVEVHHNTSDGLDLLYLESAASVEASRLRIWSNSGNPVKASAPLVMINSLLVSDCAYFEGRAPLVDHCRAGGNTLAVSHRPGMVATVVNSTLSGEGDCLVEATCEAGGCTGAEQLNLVNVLFLGQADWHQPWEQTCFAWYDHSTLPADPVQVDHALIWNVKGDPCPTGAGDVCADPQLAGGSMDGFDGHLTPASPAVNAGTAAGVPATDLEGTARDAQPDIGAYELGSVIFADGFETGATGAWSTTVG